ncbi:hypothetical protein Bca101_084719 [Brassica carinata]
MLANEEQNKRMDIGSRIEIMVGWTSPRVGWMKLNTDGASHGNPGPACSAPLAELWEVYYGLVVTWERGIRRLELEVDSKMVFLTTWIGDAHPLSFLVRLCHGFLKRDWLVRIVHVYGEANRLADGLANLTFSFQFGFHRLDDAPLDVVGLLREDVDGPLRPRQTSL